MGLFSNEKRPKINSNRATSGFLGWSKCAGCEEMLHQKEISKNSGCCPKCDYHFPITVPDRINSLADKGSFQELFVELESCDPLGFVDSEPYVERLKKGKKKSGSSEAVRVGTCRLKGKKVALGIFDFNFMGGSMGSVVGERLTRLMELAYEEELPLIIVSSSGGARMQESIFSLMQMAKTSAALAKLHEASIPYISILTNPTLGGVTASFATLGDIIIAEPHTLVGFAGPRVVEQVMRQKLPPGAQRAEFVLKQGMIDCIIPRKELKEKIALFLEFLTGNQRSKVANTFPRRTKKIPLRELHLGRK